jgi:hypothetical protein
MLKCFYCRRRFCDDAAGQLAWQEHSISEQPDEHSSWIERSRVQASTSDMAPDPGARVAFAPVMIRPEREGMPC